MSLRQNQLRPRLIALACAWVAALTPQMHFAAETPTSVRALVQRRARGNLPLRTEVTWELGQTNEPSADVCEIQWSDDGISDWQPVKTSSRPYHRETYRVEVKDGRLNVAIIDRLSHPDGVKDGNAVLNGCEITRVSGRARAARFDFGPGPVNVQPGFVPVTNDVVYRRGYGFASGKMPKGASDRPQTVQTSVDKSEVALVRDLVWGPSMEFVVDLPRGMYDVTLSMGDALYAHDHMMIQLEGRTVENDLSTAKMETASAAKNSNRRLVDERTYRKRYYRVRALDPNGTSTPWSEVACVTNTAVSRALLLSAEATPEGLRIQWPATFETRQGMFQHQILRKSLGVSQWQLVAEVAPRPDANGWVDTNVKPESAFEYQVIRLDRSSGRGDTALLYAGKQFQPQFNKRGRAVLVVDRAIARGLRVELNRYGQDLIGDGWAVSRLEVDRHADLYSGSRPAGYPQSVTKVRGMIKEVNDRFGDVRAVILIGHVPIPYSGTSLALDGHSSRSGGAWVADIYYGDLDGRDGIDWTDTATDTVTEIPNQRFYTPSRNVPGDGKFDQNWLISEQNSDSSGNRFPEAYVGRIDMAHLDAFRSGRSFTTNDELRLLKRYFAKNHDFRHGKLKAKRQALVRDDFHGGTAASFWRSFSPLFGNRNIIGGDWFLSKSFPYSLFGYVGTFGVIVKNEQVDPMYGIGLVDVAHTEDLARRGDTRCVFTGIYGSYIANWDSQDNFMRATLADEGPSLVVFWAPGSGYHHFMGLGETIGFGQWYSMRAIQFGHTSAYRHPTYTSLLGDPTLRLHVVEPPTRLRARNQGDTVHLTWRAPRDKSIVGYHVYRRTVKHGMERITDLPIRETRFSTKANAGAIYMVRAIKLETSGSGSYYNASQGVFARVRS